MRKRGEIELQRDLFISQRGGNGNAESDATAPPVARSATNSKESNNKFLFPVHPSRNTDSFSDIPGTSQNIHVLNIMHVEP